MKLYLVRHGQTVGNVQKFFQSPTTPLTNLGRKQAKKVAERLKGTQIDLIYTSTHTRATSTAGEIGKVLDVAIEPWSYLIESKGPSELWNVQHDDKKAVSIMDKVTKNYYLKDKKHSDEENFYDLEMRASKILDHLLEKHSDQTVLCVSHATFIKFLVAKALFAEKLSAELAKTFSRNVSSENTGISLLEYVEPGRWKLLTWNDTNHL